MLVPSVDRNFFIHSNGKLGGIKYPTPPPIYVPNLLSSINTATAEEVVVHFQVRVSASGPETVAVYPSAAVSRYSLWCNNNIQVICTVLHYPGNANSVTYFRLSSQDNNIQDI